MKKPIKGMDQIPFGHDVMAGAWLGLIIYAFSVEDHREQFKKETGIVISDVINARGINAAIDQATGYQCDAIAKWADWVTLNLWGLEEPK